MQYTDDEMTEQARRDNEIECDYRARSALVDAMMRAGVRASVIIWPDERSAYLEPYSGASVDSAYAAAAALFGVAYDALEDDRGAVDHALLVCYETLYAAAAHDLASRIVIDLEPTSDTRLGLDWMSADERAQVDDDASLAALDSEIERQIMAAYPGAEIHWLTAHDASQNRRPCVVQAGTEDADEIWDTVREISQRIFDGGEFWVRRSK